MKIQIGFSEDMVHEYIFLEWTVTPTETRIGKTGRDGQ